MFHAFSQWFESGDIHDSLFPCVTWCDLGRPNESWKTASKNAVATCSIVWWHQVLHQLHSTPPKLRRSTVLLYSFLFTDFGIIDVPPSSLWTKVAAVWDLGLASKILWNFWNAHKRSTLGAWKKKLKKRQVGQGSHHRFGPKMTQNLTHKGLSHHRRSGSSLRLVVEKIVSL